MRRLRGDRWRVVVDGWRVAGGGWRVVGLERRTFAEREATMRRLRGDRWRVMGGGLAEDCGRIWGGGWCVAGCLRSVGGSVDLPSRKSRPVYSTRIRYPSRKTRRRRRQRLPQDLAAVHRSILCGPPDLRSEGKRIGRCAWRSSSFGGSLDILRRIFDPPSADVPCYQRVTAGLRRCARAIVMGGAPRVIDRRKSPKPPVFVKSAMHVLAISHCPESALDQDRRLRAAVIRNTGLPQNLWVETQRAGSAQARQEGFPSRLHLRSAPVN